PLPGMWCPRPLPRETARRCPPGHVPVPGFGHPAPPRPGEPAHARRARRDVGGSLLDATKDGRPIRSPADIAAYLGPELGDLAQEQLRVVCLDTKNRVLATALVYQGGLNATVIRLADCFREAVRLGAAAIVLVHNHPS